MLGTTVGGLDYSYERRYKIIISSIYIKGIILHQGQFKWWERSTMLAIAT